MNLVITQPPGLGRQGCGLTVREGLPPPRSPLTERYPLDRKWTPCINLLRRLTAPTTCDEPAIRHKRNHTAPKGPLRQHRTCQLTLTTASSVSVFQPIIYRRCASEIVIIPPGRFAIQTSFERRLKPRAFNIARRGTPASPRRERRGPSSSFLGVKSQASSSSAPRQTHRESEIAARSLRGRRRNGLAKLADQIKTCATETRG